MAAFSMQVCMDTSEWLKDIVSDAADTAGSMDNSNSSSPSATELICIHPPPPALERRLRPPHDQALKCPRCNSTHTKFCYYNNYSLSQPRYFCKTCRRYWTKGGSLRNVPVGGGCRKNKRSAAKKSQVTDHIASQFIPQHHQVTDLQLSNLNFIFEGSSYLFMGSCDVGPGTENLSHGFLNSMELSIDEACQRLALPFEAQEGAGAAEMKPGNITLSLEWPERGDSNGCGNGGMGMWAEMVGGHGPSSSAM